MKDNSIIKAVHEYFYGLPDALFPGDLKADATVVLTGSAGWGIAEGYDVNADWDLHILLENDKYQSLVKNFGRHYVIDDHDHRPIVFGQIRNRSWLSERLSGEKAGSWPLYLWIYTRCKFVQDPLNIQSEVTKHQSRFNEEINELLRTHFVLFSVRRFDTNAALKRGITTALSINRAEMVKAALHTFSIAYGQPYPYVKWLAKHVEQLNDDGVGFVQLCNRCLSVSNLNETQTHMKSLKKKLENLMMETVGSQRWITHWWEFNEN